VRIDLGDLLVASIPGRRFRHDLGPFHPVLGAADPRQGGTRLDEAVVYLQLLERLLDDRQLIGRIVDDEIP
jgi:hypothetical protein